LRIICPKCGTEYFLESEQLDQEGTPVQCSACEHTFTVYGPETPRKVDRQTDPAAAPPLPPPTPKLPTPTPPAAPLGRRTPTPRNAGSKSSGRSRGASLFLAQGDRIYKVKDAATLQRWIVEKRILPNDRVSSDGKSWDVVSARPDLRPFFAIIEQLKSAKRDLRKVESQVALPPVGGHDAPALAQSGDAPPVALPPAPPPTPKPAEELTEPPGPVAASASASLDPSAAFAASQASIGSQAPQGAQDSFWKMKDVSELPEELAESDVTGSANNMETRAVPAQVPSTRKVPVEGEASRSQQNGIATPTGPTPAITTAELASAQLPSPSSDFDPNQTFSDDDDTFEAAPVRSMFVPVVLLVVAGAAAAIWYFQVGPGRTDVYSTGNRVADASTPTPVAEASPEVSPEEAPEPTPQATPEATPAPTPKATPKPKTTPKPKATPGSSRTKPAAGARSKVDHLKAGDAARGRGQFAKAADAYAKALDADPSNFQAALQAGWMNVELGRNAAAVSSFKKALKLRGTSAESHYGLGLAYQARGQVSAAIAEYERVVELDPDGRDTREVKAILRQLKP
jgi:predicted Zn finger-like uncharacterized protein